MQITVALTTDLAHPCAIAVGACLPMPTENIFQFIPHGFRWYHEKIHVQIAALQFGIRPVSFGRTVEHFVVFGERFTR